MAKGLRPQHRIVSKRFSTPDRFVAMALALAWIGAGATAIVLGINNRQWVAVIVGAIAVFYGTLWVRVVRQGRRLDWREALFPWRRE